MKVLIAEDDKTSRVMLTNMLKKWGYSVSAAEDGLKALNGMSEPDAPKLVLLDWNMPILSGLEVCRKLREHETANPPYIILLTAKTETDDIVLGLNTGASDYICKPYKNEELRARLRVGERMLKLQSELNEAKGILVHQAMHDPLTNMYNRRAISDVLNHEMARARRTEKPLSVGLCDLDYFKNINDCYGHPAGDEVLKAFARTVQATLRQTDYMGRWGGEEFLIIAPGSGGEDPESLFERVRANVENMKPPQEIHPARVTVSIGVAAGIGEESAEAIIHAADKAMYEAKGKGRNRVAYAKPIEPKNEFSGCEED